MKPEQIHDALNSLDDRLIEETDELRNRKRPSQWKKWAAMAACLCLAVLGTVAAFALSRNRNEKSEAISRETVQEAMGETDEIPEKEEIKEEIGEQEGAAVEMAEEFQVRILAWQEDGFEGEIVSPADTGLSTGDKVKVRLMHAGALTEKFPEGSLVFPVVMEPETDTDETETVPVIYAADLLPCD